MGLDTLFATAIFQELKRRTEVDSGHPVAENLHARIVQAAPGIERILCETRRYFGEFTDHSFDHSVRILHNIGRLIPTENLRRRNPDSSVLSSIDLFLLVASALVHDIGMVVPESEARELENKLGLIGELDVTSKAYLGTARLRVAEYVRRAHPQRSMKMLLEPRFIPRSLHNDVSTILNTLGSIVAAHGWDFDEVYRLPRRIELQLEGALQEECNPRFVAICLRLGDLLDIGTARVCPMLRALSEPLTFVSKAHWDQYKNVSLGEFRPASEIEILGTCPTQEAERVLREWVGWLERETANAVRLQNTDEARYHLPLGRIRYRVTPEEVNGVPAYEFTELRLNLDEKRVFERLFGKALYGREELALRELVQNAVDAQRARCLLTLSAGHDWSGLDAATRDERFNQSLRQSAQNNQLTVRVWRDEANGERRRWLSVEDNGIGMNRDTIANYLLKVGRSRWTEDRYATELGIGAKTIGSFGIGFISALMISDRIVVDTRSCLPNETGIQATIYGWQGFVATSPSQRPNPGTKVSLRLLELSRSPRVVRCCSAEGGQGRSSDRKCDRSRN